MSDFLALAGLALVDSLSVGTLVIPIALIFVWRRVCFGLLGAYLTTIGGAYCGLGIALLFGFEAVVQRFSGVAEADWFRWVTLVLGVGLFLFGVAAPNPKKQAAKGSDSVEQPSVASVDAAAATITSAAALPDADVREGRAFRLARGVSLSVSGMVALALGAAVVEAATMLPYLGAMGIIQSMDVQQDCADCGLLRRHDLASDSDERHRGRRGARYFSAAGACHWPAGVRSQGDTAVDRGNRWFVYGVQECGAARADGLSNR